MMGKWIDNAPGKPTKTCPDCGFELCGWAYRSEFKYCPNCGKQRA